MLITKQKLMEELSISYDTVARYLRAGMPVERLGKRNLRFDLEKVKEWLRRQ